MTTLNAGLEGCTQIAGSSASPRRALAGGALSVTVSSSMSNTSWVSTTGMTTGRNGTVPPGAVTGGTVPLGVVMGGTVLPGVVTGGSVPLDVGAGGIVPPSSTVGGT